jgi:hypothetical protein
MAVFVQPLPGSHPSVVQALPSSQLMAVFVQPETALQPSAVQASPSSHVALMLVLRHPESGSHVSAVQALPSLQFTGTPGVQTPAAHVSSPLHTSPSGHGVGAGRLMFTHMFSTSSHRSAVQGLRSSQPNGVPVHTPP